MTPTPTSRRLVATLALLQLAAAVAPGTAAVAQFSQDELFSFAQQAYLKASNTGAQDGFGSRAALSGDTLVVGVYGEDSNATGVNGNQLDNSAAFAGAAYVFVRSGGTWTQQAYLKASNTEAGDWFGFSVAIAGETIVVGARGEASIASRVDGIQGDNSAPNAGAAYVFVRSGSSWSQQAYLKASNTGTGDAFGTSVAISGDTVVVGATAEDSSAPGVNGNQVDNSAVNSGAGYVFVRSGTSWSQQAYLKASNPGAQDLFGTSAAISGDTLVVGAEREGSNATGVNGNQFDNSILYAGAAYVFVRSGTIWSQQAYLKASNPGAEHLFGESVAILGDTVVVSAPYEGSNATGVNGNQNDSSAYGAGAVYVFVRSNSIWSQQAYLKASNTDAWDTFGWSVAISGDIIVVGACCEGSNATGVNGNQDNDSAPFSGAAYVFVRSGSTWTQPAYLKASNTGGRFGSGVAISGDTIAVGAESERSNATGVNGNQNDNSAQGAGAAYVFRFEEEDPPPPAGGWQQTSALPGYRFKTLIGGDRLGTLVADCVPQTLCIAGAIPTRAELFVRLIGPRGNGKLWAQAVRFTVSQVELWIEQTATGEVNYYLLEALPASTETLPGVNDSLAFNP